MIYTKTGDKGYTSLANGKRVSKCTGLLEAYGTADELNAQMGMLRCKVQASRMAALDADLEWIQNKLFNLGASLACALGEWITKEDVSHIETLIDQMEADLPCLKGFILPSGDEAMCQAHICRTVARRLERNMLKVHQKKNEDRAWSHECIFVNRLSDFLFVVAKKIAKNNGFEMFFWKK